MILLVVLFVLLLIILWLILDYHFIRLKKTTPFNIVVAGPLSNEDAEMLKNLISDHNAKIELVDPCGYTQPLSE